MWTLRVVARIPEDKRQEFTQSVQALLEPELSRGCRALVLRGVDDAGLFCWMADWEDPLELTAFLRSRDYRALKGAAEVLGGIEDVTLLRDGTPDPGER